MGKLESPFEDEQLWYFDELEGEYLEQAIDAGCEPGKVYWGDPIWKHEVPACPFCSEPSWLHSISGCQHIIFVYDVNSGYSYLHPDFVKAFWKNIYPRKKEMLDCYSPSEVNEMISNKRLPNYTIIVDIVEESVTRFAGSPCRRVGLYYGYCSDNVLEELNIKEDINYGSSSIWCMSPCP